MKSRIKLMDLLKFNQVLDNCITECDCMLLFGKTSTMILNENI